MTINTFFFESKNLIYVNAKMQFGIDFTFDVFYISACLGSDDAFFVVNSEY